MSPKGARVAVFPGTFDPLTYGHLDIAKRGAGLFERLIIGVGLNPAKQELFTPQERVEMIRLEVKEIPNIEVESFTGLTIEFVRKVSAKVILRGIRDSVDLRDELQAANTNMMVGGIETIFLLTTDQHALTSSSLIRQVVDLGVSDRKKLTRIVPAAVLDKLLEKAT